ncbi:hypothetical protein AD998_06645 [bacterium 336/3]|nr:hypothetical protein AD998_06645 [bacterium 336/3]
MKTYLLGLWCLITTFLFQYAASWGLILISYFSGWIYPMGGFIVWIAMFGLLYMYLAKWLIESKLTPYPKYISEIEIKKMPISEYKAYTQLRSKYNTESLQYSRETSTTMKIGVVLLLLGSFLLNLHLKDESEKYEFQHFGRQVKGIVIKKYRTITGKGAKIPYLSCSFLENHVIKKIDMLIENDTIYARKKVGDTLEFIYSTRNHYFFKIIK